MSLAGYWVAICPLRRLFDTNRIIVALCLFFFSAANDPEATEENGRFAVPGESDPVDYNAAQYDATLRPMHQGEF